MKKAISLMLAIVLCLGLYACGGKNSKSPQMSKEDMLAAAEVVTPSQITSDVNSNIAKAKQLYCEKVLEVTGRVASVKEDYVEVGVDSTTTGTVIDVYLPMEELVLLASGQKITIVAKNKRRI